MSDSYDDTECKGYFLELMELQEKETENAASDVKELEEFWITKDGKRIRYRDMPQSHLENALNMLRRKEEELTQMQYVAFEALKKEMKRRVINAKTSQRKMEYGK